MTHTAAGIILLSSRTSDILRPDLRTPFMLILNENKALYLRGFIFFSLVLLLSGCSIPRPGTRMTASGVRFVLAAPLAVKVAVVGDLGH